MQKAQITAAIKAPNAGVDIQKSDLSVILSWGGGGLWRSAAGNVVSWSSNSRDSNWATTSTVSMSSTAARRDRNRCRSRAFNAAPAPPPPRPAGSLQLGRAHCAFGSLMVMEIWHWKNSCMRSAYLKTCAWIKGILQDKTINFDKIPSEQTMRRFVTFKTLHTSSFLN